MRSQTQRARTLRHDLSKPEVILWSRLRHLRERGFHIRRQAPFKGYYLDFVCYSRRIVIEVDGSRHGDDRQAEHDGVRDAILRRYGFQVLRFWASDVRWNLGWVMDQIVLALEAAPPVKKGAFHRARSPVEASPP